MTRLRITKPNLRDTGSEGEGVWLDSVQLWWVTLERQEPPFRGHYSSDEVVEADADAKAGA